MDKQNDVSQNFIRKHHPCSGPVERLLPTPEILGSNPDIGKFYLPSNILNVLKRQQIKKCRELHAKTLYRMFLGQVS